MKKISTFLAGTLLFLSPAHLFSQIAPNLNTASSFVLFTGNGEFTSNSSSTNVIGNVGNVVGAVTAFPPGTLTGSKHFGDAAAIQANNDIIAAYADLAGRTCSIAHVVGFGGGETLTPDTYCSTAASTLNGNLILDAGGNSAAVFIIKIDGAFSAASGSQIILTNQASSCNVFWQINGAVDLNNTDFKGTMLVNGAISLNVGTNLTGKALTKTGALIFDNINVTICDLSLLPIKLANFDVVKNNAGNAQLTWLTPSDVNMLRYEIESSINASAFNKTGTIVSKGNNFPTQYSFQDVTQNKTGVYFYRLKMIDKDGGFTYSMVKSIQFSEIKTGLINLFPNPATSTINLTINAETRENVILTIANMKGQKIIQKDLILNKGINNIPEDIHNLLNAVYIISIQNLIKGKESHLNFQKL